jgi:succinate dehydrogenase / fumarate reductase cytochrome b subunit
MNIITRLFKSSIGKKYVMAVTGCLLFGFVIVHLLGNLQIYLGPDAINAYAALLQGNKLILWSFRIGLGGLVLLHVTTAAALAVENRSARPVAYLNSKPPYSSVAARTMVLSGSIIFVFIVFHILHFTAGLAQPDVMHFTDPKGRHDVYKMMILGFSNPWVSAIYLTGMTLLYLHLSHGIGSFFQSLGLKNRHYGEIILGFSQGAALLIFLGNCSIPIAILTGILHLPK